MFNALYRHLVDEIMSNYAICANLPIYIEMLNVYSWSSQKKQLIKATS